MISKAEVNPEGFLGSPFKIFVARGSSVSKIWTYGVPPILVSVVH